MLLSRTRFVLAITRVHLLSVPWSRSCVWLCRSHFTVDQIKYKCVFISLNFCVQVGCSEGYSFFFVSGRPHCTLGGCWSWFLVFSIENRILSTLSPLQWNQSNALSPLGALVPSRIQFTPLGHYYFQVPY